MPNIALPCIYCQQQFIPTESRENSQKYCSEQHRKSAWKKRHHQQVLEAEKIRKKRITHKDWIEKNCIVCQKSFLPPITNKYQKYCGYKCRNKANTTPEKKKLWSANWRRNHLEEIKKKDYEYKAKRRFGAISKTLNKELVIKRDKGLCKLCNVPFQIIHHIRYSGKIEDLVLLCRACHASIHQRARKEPYWIGEYNF